LRFHKFVKHMQKPYPEIKAMLSPLHENIFQYVDARVKDLTNEVDALDFASATKSIELLRKLGQVLTGIYAVYYEDIRDFVEDVSLKHLNDICSLHFGGKALSNLGPFYALLEVPPNASQEDIDKAFRRKSLEHHPDAQARLGISRDNPSEMQQKIIHAKDVLSDAKVREHYQRGFLEPFADIVKRLPQKLRETASESLHARDYDRTKALMIAVKDLHLLSSLVETTMDADAVRKSISIAVKEHVNQIYANVNKHWSKHELKGLNQELSTLDRIDASFSAYSDIYSSSWSNAIKKIVEDDIEAIATKARGILQGNEDDQQMHTFAFQLVRLGHIFDDLPRFKDYAKLKMGELLDCCQDQGEVGYLFKLGMLLEQGKVGTLDDQGNVVSEDQRISRVILSSFRHFKDVMTVVWNQQTGGTQKDITATVNEISSKRVSRGQSPIDVDVDQDLLSQGFQKYSEEYNKLFHEWRAGQLQLEELARELVTKAKKLQPCRVGMWGKLAKDSLPFLLAGIAIHFTISKSGDSYHRLLKAGSGHGQRITLQPASANCQSAKLTTEDVLQKPHNIQILTILRLFGYDSNSQSLANQLMQIRTGEGKSMILGMSSLLFSLLGFRVRCVCYSEYLSQRDHALFKEMFAAFGVSDQIHYSKITTFSEDQTAAKGNIRELSLDLMHGRIASGQAAPTRTSEAPHPATICHARLSAPPAQASNAFSMLSTTPHAALAGPAAARPGVSSQSAAMNPPGAPGASSSLARGSPVPPCAPSFGAPSSSLSTAAAASSWLARGSSAPPRAPSSGTPTVAENAFASPTPSSTQEEILLVDEVDMFFGQDFYGQTHNQVALLDCQEVPLILATIWDSRTEPRGIVLEAVKKSAEYKELLRRFLGWEFLLDSEVSAMCHDVQHFETPPYHCDRGGNRIGYKAMDGICFDVVYGYRTAFAYLNEHMKNNFQDSKQALKSALKLRVSCGQFSYANIKPACILGVSGTVAALGDQEWDIMNRYGIDTYTNMPSVYGLSNFKFLDQEVGDPITITPSRDEHWMAITNEVITKTKKKRAVIVLFADAARLKAYEASPYFQQVANKNVLSENQSHDEKEYVIKKAATGGQATFTSAVFGRGTDFFCNDSRVHEVGGVHIVHAFFSLDKSEEVQIQGRTARQGKKGTYSMVLLEEELQKQLGITARLSGQMASRDMYNFLETKRQEYHHAKHSTIEESLRVATERDTLTHKYFDSLLAGQSQKATVLFKDMYQKIKTSSSGGGAHHVVFCLDESSSMQGQSWTDLKVAFGKFLETRIAQEGNAQDVVSVVTFGSTARIVFSMSSLEDARRRSIGFHSGGTAFKPALDCAKQLFTEGAGKSLTPVLIFMSDGANDDGDCTGNMKDLHTNFNDLQCHTIFFGSGGSSHLQRMAAAVPNGAYHLSVNGVQLSKAFNAIALGAEYTAARDM